MTNDERMELEGLIEQYGISKQILAAQDHREGFRELARDGVRKAWAQIMECLNRIDA